MADAFDLVVIGAGPAGYTCAHRAAELGLSVLVADPRPLGGVCLNQGCIPTKGLLLPPHPDGIASRTRANEAAIERLRQGVAHLLKGCTVAAGRARLAGPNRVWVEGVGEVAASRVVIATGSRPRELPGLPLDGKRVMSSDQAVAPESVPGRVTVIGAGAVGVEFADVFAAYGAQVTVIEQAERLLPELDPWLSAHLARAFKRRGIRVLTGATVAGTGTTGGDAVALSVATPGGAEELRVERVLVAVGREPLTADLGLETVGLEPDPAGFLSVDGWGRTGVEGVFAIGDVTGPPLLAHRAYAQGRIAAETAVGRQPEPLHGERIPACVYTHPQLASVGTPFAEGAGLICAEARFAPNGLAVVRGEAEGAVRLVARESSGLIAGAQLAGPEVTEMVGLIGALIVAGATIGDLRKAVFPHPTLSEVVWEAAG